MNKTKKNLQKGAVDDLQSRLDRLKYGVKKMVMTTIISLGGSGGTPSPGPGLPKTQTINDLTQRLDRLCSNTEEVLPHNTPQQNSRIIAQKNNEKFLNRQINQRQKELSKLPKGIVKKSKVDYKL